MGGGNQQSGSAFEQSANAMTTGLQTMGAAVNPMAVPMTMNQYINPYQNQVIDNTVGRMYDDMQVGLNDVRGQAAQASAYGGARHGLVEAELMDRYHRNMGETAMTMNQQGFDTAATFGQNRIGQLLAGGQGLMGGASTAYGLGQSALQGQQAAGNQQQSLMQQILSQATGQYDTMANYPQSQLATALAGVQGNPMSGAGISTSGYNPGLFDYLGFGAGIAGGGK